MDDLRHLLPLVIIGGSFAFAGAIMYGAWALGRYRGREDARPADMENLDIRLARVEYAVSQTTGALDRLEAAHRYALRAMMESPNSAPKLVERPVTPH